MKKDRPLRSKEIPLDHPNDLRNFRNDELEELLLGEEGSPGSTLKAEALREIWKRHLDYTVNVKSWLQLVELYLIVHLGFFILIPLPYWYYRVAAFLGAVFAWVLGRYLIRYVPFNQGPEKDE